MSRGTRPFVDRPIADGVAAATAAAAAADEWGLAAPTVLRIGMNAIYRCDDVVLRVSSPTAPATVAIELAELLRDHGVPVPPPARSEPIVVDELTVTAWPFLAAVDAPIDWATVGHHVRRVHQLAASDLPPELPTPSPVDFAWWDFDRLLTETSVRLDAAAEAGLEATIDRHRGWNTFEAHDTVVCHGDVHPGNVVQTADGPVLIDWDLLCLAPAGWDHAPLITITERWGAPEGVYEAFASGYGASMRSDRWAADFAELRLVAATLMRVKASLRDEAAWPEAERRLRHWRGDPDAPRWSAV
ncbi:MAG: aminoglycoside phosphotransferase family protein [Actinomycetota bacterium]